MRKEKRGPAKHISKIDGLRVVLCCDTDSNLADWKIELQRSRVELTHMWPPPQRLGGEIDVLICEYMPQMADFIPWMPGDAEAALVVLLPQSQKYDERILLAAAPQSVLQRPFPPSFLPVTVKVAWNQFRYERRLNDRISRLDENLRAIRDVERAKLIIMAEKKLGEEAAYRHLRELAMQRQVTIATLATSIVHNPILP